MGSGEDNQNAPLWPLEEETIPGQVEGLLTRTRLVGKRRRPPHPRTTGNFQEPTKHQHKNHERYQSKNMALPPPVSTSVPLRSADGIITLHYSTARDGTIGICIVIIPHLSNNIRILRTTYSPLNDGSGDFTERHESSRISTLPGERNLPQSTSPAANHTTPATSERPAKTPPRSTPFVFGTPERHPEGTPSQNTTPDPTTQCPTASQSADLRNYVLSRGRPQDPTEPLALGDKDKNPLPNPE